MSESTSTLRAEDFAAPRDLNRLQVVALAAALVGGAAALVGFGQNPEQFYRSNLVSYLFWLSIPLGCLGLMMLQHMTQGAWGLTARRVHEAAAASLWLMALLFVPIYLGMKEIFLWARPEKVQGDYLLEKKVWYLNADGFLMRAIVLFAIWLLLTTLLRYFSRRQDSAPSAKLVLRMRQVSGPGIVLFAITGTLASVDWLMSLDPHYYSSIYGAYFLISQALAGMAFVILATAYLARRAPLDSTSKAEHFHDRGKLLLAFVLVWAYFSVSQFLITWSGNLPEEVIWYLHRQHGGWSVVSIGLILLHFALPFALLLSRARKRNPARLARVALLILVMHWVDYYWQAGPVFHEHFAVHWLDFATLLAIGGLWTWTVLALLKRRPLLPVSDPYLPEALAHD